MLRIFTKSLIRNKSTTFLPNGLIFTRKLHSIQLKNIKYHPSILVATTTLGGYLLLQEFKYKVLCEQNSEPQKKKLHETIRDDLPFISDEELAKHDNKYHICESPGVDTFDVIGNGWKIERENRVWVSYGVGVYDITDLIDKHGTPEVTIMLAAGMSLDQFWEDEEMARIHNKPYIPGMMEKCRIGNLKVAE